MKRAPDLKLVWNVEGRLQTRSFNENQAGGMIKIGRGETNDLQLLCSSVSREHATLETENGHWVLRDQNSANGTWINHIQVTERSLTSGTTIRFGSEEVTCTMTADSAPPIPKHEAITSLPIEDDSEVYDSDLEDPLVTSELDVGDFDVLVERILAPPHQTQTPDAGSLPIPPPRHAVSVLRKAMDTLIEQHSLDKTLSSVLDLVFDHIPCERGIILLLDQAGSLTPAVRRTRESDNEEIRISSGITKQAVDHQRALLVQDARSDERFMNMQSVVDLNIRSALCAPFCREGRVVGVVYVDRTSLGGVFQEEHLELLSLLASLSAAAVEHSQVRDLADRERALRDRLSRYSPPNVVQHLVQAHGDANVLAVEERQVTVLFVDLVGFTALSENLPPRKVTEILNDVFELLTKEVFREGGTLDKFIGDALMAFWGAPVAQKDHAERAVRAALAMQRRLLERKADPSLPKIEMRIGINTGEAIVGDIGVKDRRDYTVIGDTVNVASRLESSVAKAGELIIGSDTRALLGPLFSCSELGTSILKGRFKGCAAFRVHGINQAEE